MQVGTTAYTAAGSTEDKSIWLTIARKLGEIYEIPLAAFLKVRKVTYQFVRNFSRQLGCKVRVNPEPDVIELSNTHRAAILN